jgi:hypothetical protein
MRKQLIPICTVTFVVLAMTLNVASARGGSKGDLRYEYHFGDASPACDDVMPTDDPIPVGSSPTCRPEAVAEFNPNAPPPTVELTMKLLGGGSIAIQGAGELTLSKKGKPKHVDGEGPYAIFGPPTMHDPHGKLLEYGSWKAKKLIQFDSYGSSPTLPVFVNAGRAMIQIRLDPVSGKKSDAILEVGCRLGAGNPGIPGTIEGVRVMIDGGLYYNLPADPKSTVFIDLN